MQIMNIDQLKLWDTIKKIMKSFKIIVSAKGRFRADKTVFVIIKGVTNQLNTEDNLMKTQVDKLFLWIKRSFNCSQDRLKIPLKSNLSVLTNQDHNRKKEIWYKNLMLCNRNWNSWISIISIQKNQHKSDQSRTRILQNQKILDNPIVLSLEVSSKPFNTNHLRNFKENNLNIKLLYRLIGM